jgi:hypothetical protein
MNRWQVKAIYLFSHDSRRRDIIFDLNSVNIVTGSSGSGKSALCEILDYCLGSGNCHIPGIVRDATSWVAILLSNGKTEAFIARREPPPDQLSTDEVALSFGAHVRIPDSAEQLEGNTNTSTLVRRLEQLFEIGNVTTEVFAGTRQPGKVSARNLVPFLIQDDDVIINKTVLFRGAQDERRLSIIDSFPYFLGVSDEETIAQEAEFRRLSGQLASEERRIAAIERQRENTEVDLREIAAEASGVGLLDLPIQDASPERLRTALAKITEWSPEADADTGDDRISQLSDLRQRLFFQRATLNAQINEAREALREAQQFVSISERQERRLQSIELFGSSDQPMEECPVCSNKILQNTSTLTMLRASYRELQNQLTSAQRERPQIDGYIAGLQNNIDELTGQLNSVKAQIRGTLNEAGAVQEKLSLTQRKLRVAGRVSYFLEQVEHAEKPVSYAKRDDLRLQIAKLQESVDVQSKLDRIQDAQQEIGISADSILSELPFPASYPKRRVFLNVRDLTTGIITEQRRVQMRDIGSDENYLSIHVSVLLSLHRFFKMHDRPVPGFIVFDQLSRPFYPPDKMPGIVETRSDGERVELKKYFDVLFNEVERQTDFQIIVLEHAFFADDERYVKAVGKRSLEGEKLIPADWPLST